MIMIMIIIIAIVITFAIFWLYMVLRNNAVYKERMRVLEIAHKKAEIAIRNNKDDYMSHYEITNRYSYNEMFYKFWIPVKDFYRDIQ